MDFDYLKCSSGIIWKLSLWFMCFGSDIYLNAFNLKHRIGLTQKTSKTNWQPNFNFFFCNCDKMSNQKHSCIQKIIVVVFVLGVDVF